MAEPLARRIHLVVPMSGSGSRFVAQGITTPKPLIRVLGIPIVQHVLDRFPGVGKVTFICNRNHADSTDLLGQLAAICPTANIRVIAPHKLGPVHAVAQVYDLIHDDEPVVVNYCDFNWEWDFQEFLVQMASCAWDGAVVGYTGFHPHLVGPDLYATMRVEQNRVLQIQEKHAFSPDRFQEFTSSGTYYFAAGRTLKWAFDAAVATNLSIQGEFYASSPYQLMLDAGKRVGWFPVTRFCQWGTPQDLATYTAWSQVFEARSAPVPPRHHIPNLVMLMAGRGERFASQGYGVPKPFIPVAGSSMAHQALANLPSPDRLVLALQTHMVEQFPVELEALSTLSGQTHLLTLDHPTQGQACTARLALDLLPDDQEVLVASCDASFRIDPLRFARLLKEFNPDAVLFTHTGYQPACWFPNRYGWVRTQGQAVRGVSTKIPISDTPASDPLVVGAFYFRTVALAKSCIDQLVASDRRTNGEFYLDDCADLMASSNHKVAHFPVSHYTSWGTPDELNTFQYWQAHFHQSPHHPYRIENETQTAPRPPRTMP